jgi:hypothetical protein
LGPGIGPGRPWLFEPHARSLSSSAGGNAAITRVAPGVLMLHTAGMPRTQAAIITALLVRHPRDEVKRAIAWLAVLGRIDDRGGSKYTLASPEAEPG